MHQSSVFFLWGDGGGGGQDFEPTQGYCNIFRLSNVNPILSPLDY